jgi:hypothetical protein
MFGPGSRRPVRPLTIYGFRRRRMGPGRLSVLLFALLSVFVLPRFLSPIAGRFFHVSKTQEKSVAESRTKDALAPDPANALASPQPAPVPSTSVVELPAPESAPPPLADTLHAGAQTSSTTTETKRVLPVTPRPATRPKLVQRSITGPPVVAPAEVEPVKPDPAPSTPKPRKESRLVPAPQ